MNISPSTGLHIPTRTRPGRRRSQLISRTMPEQSTTFGTQTMTTPPRTVPMATAVTQTAGEMNHRRHTTFLLLKYIVSPCEVRARTESQPRERGGWSLVSTTERRGKISNIFSVFHSPTNHDWLQFNHNLFNCSVSRYCCVMPRDGSWRNQNWAQWDDYQMKSMDQITKQYRAGLLCIMNQRCNWDCFVMDYFRGLF